MPQAVTELIVRGDGALQVLDRFEKGMEASGQATERTTGAVASFEQRMAKAAEQIAKGNALTTQSIERRTAEQRALERWQSRIDPVMNLEIKLKREAERAAVDYTNAVVFGYATQEEALRGLMTLEQQHNAQLAALANGTQRMTTLQNAAAVSNDNAAQSMNRVAAANDNARFATSNVAAQFQDVAVTAAMGMNPLMIALQQGTQLSAQLSTMQNPLKGLAGAFVSIINPVSLLTIGFVALSAVAIQWFAGAKSEAQDASSALAEHDKWLDQILDGYQSVRDAAKEAGEEARAMPQGVVELDLQAGLKEQAEEAATLDRNINQARESIAQIYSDLNSTSAPSLFGVDEGAGLDNLRQQTTILRDLGLSASSTAEELDAALVTSRKLFHETDNQPIRDMADQVFKLAQQLLGLRGRMAETETASAAMTMSLNDVPDEYGRKLETFGDITLDLADWTRDLDAAARQAAAGIKSSTEAAMLAAQGYGEAAGAANIYAGSLQRLQSLIPAVAAAQSAQNDLAAATIDYDRGMKALEEQRAGGLGRDAFYERQTALTDAFEKARDQVTGLAAVEEQLATVTSQNTIDALSGKEQAIARVNQQYAAQAEAITKTLGQGAARADVDRLLAVNSDQLAAALANTNAQFERTGAAKAGKEYDKLERSYDKIITSGQNFIAQQEVEAQSLGLTEEAANRLRYTQELLNQAANDNIALGPEQRNELTALGAAMSAVEERTRSLTEWYNFGKETLGSFFSDFRRDLMNGTSLWDSFAGAAANALDSIADRAMSMAANGIFDMIFGAVMGGLTGGGGATGGSWNGGLWGSAIFSAKGNVFESPSLSAYSNQIVDRPTMFAFARGAGVMGEAGPEAIMPLRRGPGGRLGVEVANNNQPRAANVNLTVQNINQTGRPLSVESKMVNGPNGEKQLRNVIRDEVTQARRRGAPGFGG